MTAPDPSQPLHNSRQEKFALYVAAGMAAGPAYTKSGYKIKPSARDTTASRLLRSAQVKRRVDFLKKSVAEAAVFDMSELERNSTITREMVKGMLLLQARRNLGLEKVKVDIVVRTGKKKGQTVTVERIIYDPKAANATLKMLGEETALFEGGSAAKGNRDEDMAQRAGGQTPAETDQAMGALKTVRGLVLAGGTDVAQQKVKKA